MFWRIFKFVSSALLSSSPLEKGKMHWQTPYVSSRMRSRVAPGNGRNSVSRLKYNLLRPHGKERENGELISNEKRGEEEIIQSLSRIGGATPTSLRQQKREKMNSCSRKSKPESVDGEELVSSLFAATLELGNEGKGKADWSCTRRRPRDPMVEFQTTHCPHIQGRTGGGRVPIHLFKVKEGERAAAIRTWRATK